MISPNSVLFVKVNKLCPLLVGAAPSHRADVDESTPKLDESSSFGRQLQLRHVPVVEEKYSDTNGTILRLSS